jgi:hypothetical protein
MILSCLRFIFLHVTFIQHFRYGEYVVQIQFCGHFYEYHVRNTETPFPKLHSASCDKLQHLLES